MSVTTDDVNRVEGSLGLWFVEKRIVQHLQATSPWLWLRYRIQKSIDFPVLPNTLLILGAPFCAVPIPEPHILSTA